MKAGTSFLGGKGTFIEKALTAEELGNCFTVRTMLSRQLREHARLGAGENGSEQVGANFFALREQRRDMFLSVGLGRNSRSKSWMICEPRDEELLAGITVASAVIARTFAGSQD